MSGEQAKALDDAVYAGARGGFQYRYESIRIADDPQERDVARDPVTQFARFMSSPDTLRFFEQVLKKSINFADAQATAYAPGDFLTSHNDDVEGKNRKAAYVYGLNPAWKAEWGGLLLFSDRGRIQGRVPSFNSLDLFTVPAVHSVSEVSRAAPNRRYSITGWLRDL